MTKTDTTARIRDLNDRLRCQRIGGRVMLTTGVRALEPETVRRVLATIAEFDAFTPDNDPHSEHDCAVVVIDHIRIIWKIDSYDKDLTCASSDSTDPEATSRVMTVMLAEEY